LISEKPLVWAFLDFKITVMGLGKQNLVIDDPKTFFYSTRKILSCLEEYFLGIYKKFHRGNEMHIMYLLTACSVGQTLDPALAAAVAAADLALRPDLALAAAPGLARSGAPQSTGGAAAPAVLSPRAVDQIVNWNMLSIRRVLMCSSVSAAFSQHVDLGVH
jgi:hypothetical protein